MNTNIEIKLEALKLAHIDLINELEKAYPIGMKVQVMLSSTQVNPSMATVIGHPGGKYGYVKVRLHAGKNAVKNVPTSQQCYGNIPTIQYVT